MTTENTQIDQTKKKKKTTKEVLTAVANITGSLAALSKGKSYSWDDSGEKKSMSFDQDPTANAQGKPATPPIVEKNHTQLTSPNINAFKDYNA